MLIRPACFNTYLLACLLAVLAGGCTAPSKDDKKVDKKAESALRLHLEVNPNPAGQSMRASIGRSDPLVLNVDQEPFLTELRVDKASVIDGLGGFSVAVQFNSEGAILLEQYTGAYNGRRMAIAAEFGEQRWIAAPIIRKRLADGQLVFTPDLTREEAERFVRGLNRVGELIRKGRK
jgi:preprotein translocase subunit SecD